MSCVIDNGINLGCSTVGGIKTVYIGTYDPEVTYTLDADNIITALDDNPNSVSVYNFQQDDEYAGLEQPSTVSRENGTVFQESVLTLKFIHLDAALRNQALALSKAPIFAVAESNAGDFYLLGSENAGRLTEGSLSLGTAFGDMNGASLSFTFKSENGAYLMDAAVLNTGVADPAKITVNATT